MPNISVAKPSKIVPVSFFRSSLQNMYRMMPISARIGVNDVGLSRLIQTLPLSMPARLSSHAVTVVPTFAPMITLMACRRVIRPELTKPTTMTVVADELWMMAVTPRPVKKPIAALSVILPIRLRRLLPARRSSACPIRFIPNRNRHSPPMSVSTLKISIFSPLISIFFTCAYHTGRASNPTPWFCKIRVKCALRRILSKDSRFSDCIFRGFRV